MISYMYAQYVDTFRHYSEYSTPRSVLADFLLQYAAKTLRTIASICSLYFEVYISRTSCYIQDHRALHF